MGMEVEGLCGRVDVVVGWTVNLKDHVDGIVYDKECIIERLHLEHGLPMRLPFVLGPDAVLRHVMRSRRTVQSLN